MRSPTQTATIGTTECGPETVRRMFKACIGRFDHAYRKVMDELAAWMENAYRDELASRPSKHVYINTLPVDIRAKMDRLRDSGSSIRSLANSSMTIVSGSSR